MLLIDIMDYAVHLVLSALREIIVLNAGQDFAMPLLPQERGCIQDKNNDNDIITKTRSLVRAMKQADIGNMESCIISDQLDACVNDLNNQIYKEDCNRGLFIVFEGPDKCGKTTQATLLFEYYVNLGKKVKMVKFPDRTTPSGLLINDFLKSKGLGVPIDKIPIVSHLLFAYNRWERMFVHNTNVPHAHPGIACSMIFEMEST